MLSSKKKLSPLPHCISGILSTEFQQCHIISSKTLGTENVISAFLCVFYWPVTLLTVQGSKKSTVTMPQRIIINIFRSTFSPVLWTNDKAAKNVSISNFLILSIYQILELACSFISQSHSDAEGAQRQEEHEACFLVMGPP